MDKQKNRMEIKPHTPNINPDYHPQPQPQPPPLSSASFQTGKPSVSNISSQRFSLPMLLARVIFSQTGRVPTQGRGHVGPNSRGWGGATTLLVNFASKRWGLGKSNRPTGHSHWAQVQANWRVGKPLGEGPATWGTAVCVAKRDPPPLGIPFPPPSGRPGPTLRALEDLLTFALEKDPGRYRPSSGPLILYVLRIAVQVEARGPPWAPQPPPPIRKSSNHPPPAAGDGR